MPRPFTSKLRVILLLSVTLCLALLPCPFCKEQRVEAASPSSNVIVARVHLSDENEVRRFVSLGLDLLEMREGNDLFILTDAKQLDELRAQGWQVTIDLRKSLLASEQTAETFSGGYRTVTEMRAFLDDEAARYPTLAEVFVYGSSWQRVHLGGAAGSDLFGIKLTNKQTQGPKPTFFLMAAIHARELTTSELALRFIDYLLSNYGVDADATWLLDEHQVVVVPVVNPDGRKVAEQGYYQRKNLNTTNGGACANPPTVVNQAGVDLNRNYSFDWGTVNSPSEPVCGQTYPGTSAASEPETTAIQNLVRSLFPDQRGPQRTDAAPDSATGVVITLHSYANLVLWPWGATSQPAPNANQLQTIGQKFASYNGFTPEQAIGLYPTSGTTDDWSYGELGVASYTFEVGGDSDQCGGFFPPFSCMDGGAGGSFWPRNLPAFLYAARIARAPYQLGQGPSPESVSASVSDHIQLQAQFDETYNGGQAIAAAEYYVDTPPWRGGLPFAMRAADGSFDGISETALADVGPTLGKHTFFVRARDADGNWGPVRAVFATAPTNPIDDAGAFVTQHYRDFLGREPDSDGLNYWTSQITQCGTNQQCIHDRRVGVSAAFYIELEFQETGSVIYRMYRASYGTLADAPTRANITYQQFSQDRPLLVAGQQLQQSTVNFANQFVQRTQFKTVYPDTMSNAEFVNKLYDTAGLTPYTNERLAQVTAMQNGKTRAQVLLDVIETPEFKTREYNRAFVLMQYFGYLRRDADTSGYDFWLDVLNRLPVPNNFRNMVCAFITSSEYQLRFGTTVTRRNSDCSSQ